MILASKKDRGEALGESGQSLASGILRADEWVYRGELVDGPIGVVTKGGAAGAHDGAGQRATA